MMRTTQELQQLLQRQGIKLIDQPTTEAMAPGTLILTLESYSFSPAVQIFRQILLNVMLLLSVAWSPKLICRPFYHRLGPVKE